MDKADFATFVKILNVHNKCIKLIAIDKEIKNELKNNGIKFIGIVKVHWVNWY